MAIRVLVIPGATRTESFSKKLGRAAANIVKEAGASPTFVDLRDHPMPLYDGDLEAAEGLPAEAVRLRELLKQHEAVLFATAEYNASLPAVLKNTIDWLSRPYAAEPGVSVWKGKVAGLVSSSPGALGGMRALVHLRQVLMNLGLLIVTEQFALGNAAAAFGPDGGLLDSKAKASVLTVVRSVVHVAERLGA